MSIETIKKFGPFYLNENIPEIYTQVNFTTKTPDECPFYDDVNSGFTDIEIVKSLINLKQYYMSKNSDIEVEYYVDLHVDYGFSLKVSIYEPFIHKICYLLLNIPASIINLLYENNELKIFSAINKASNISGVFTNISIEVKLAAKLE